MALARPTRPSGVDLAGPLITSHPATTVVTVVMATRPAAHLRGADRRRLARLVGGAERRLAHEALAAPARARLVRRLWGLAERASRGPAREGLALIASGDQGRHLTLRHPTTDRIVVGPPPTYEDVVEASWAFGRLAVLRLAARGARLICSDGATLWEPRPPWDPLGLQPQVGLERAELLLRSALPGRTPLLVAGDDRLVADFRRRGSDHRVVGHLPGDHSETAAATLAALAQRTMRRSLDPRQRSAMVSLALAVDRGSAVRGPAAVRGASPSAADVLLVEDTTRAEMGPLPARVAAAGGSVVALPDGFLAHHGAAALVPDHRVPAPPLLAAVPR